MDLSIVIRCSEDERLFRCIESIDEDVEIVVSISENADFQKKLKEKKIKYCISPSGNLSLTSNIGIKNSRFDRVIITDSDTVFEPGCIRLMNEALDEYSVVRARLLFRTDDRIGSSEVVASARDYVNSKELAFTPGLGIKKDLANSVGGFIFNDIVPFAVDADLNNRIRKKGVVVKYLYEAVIEHCAESYHHDLRAARRIGRGVAISANSLSNFYPDSSVRRLKHELKAVHYNDYIQIIRQKGPRTFFYQLMWDLCFYMGRMSGGRSS